MPVHFLRREFASDAAFSKTCGARCVALQPATGDQMEACSENPDAGHHGYFSIRLHFLPYAARTVRLEFFDLCLQTRAFAGQHLCA